jgi:hypothetical protein
LIILFHFNFIIFETFVCFDHLSWRHCLRCRPLQASQARAGRVISSATVPAPLCGRRCCTITTTRPSSAPSSWGHGAGVPGPSLCCVRWAGVLCAQDSQRRAAATASGIPGRAQGPHVGRPPGRPIVSGNLCQACSMLAPAGRAPARPTAAGVASLRAQARLQLHYLDGVGPGEPGRRTRTETAEGAQTPGRPRSRTRLAGYVPSVLTPRATRSLHPCTRCKP